MDIQLRKKGIGGSEVAAILGLDEYSSPYKVWLNKTGREDGSVNNKYTEAGIILESAVAEFFETKTKYRIIKASADQKTYTHPDYEFAVGTPDRIYFPTNITGRGILECKTTQNTYDDVPEKWFMQLQWYLGILDLKIGSVAWLERGLDFKYKEFEFDKDFFKYMLDAANNFWREYVLKDVPPEPINSADVERMFNKHREGAVIQATPEIVTLHEELYSTKIAIKELEAKETELTENLKLLMLDNEAIMKGTKPIVTWRTSKSSMAFDLENFRANLPEIYDQYQIEKPGSRRFLVKPT